MAGETVLVVEDEPLAAANIVESLEESGYRVSGVASSASEASTRATEEAPDLVLMDVGLGRGPDGIYAAQEIGERHNVPIIYLTAHGDQATVERAMATTPYGYLMKPVNTMGLGAAVEVALKQHRERVASYRDFGQLKAGAQTMDLGIIVTDDQGLVTELNAAAMAATGLDPEGVLGKPLAAVFQPQPVALEEVVGTLGALLNQDVSLQDGDLFRLAQANGGATVYLHMKQETAGFGPTFFHDVTGEVESLQTTSGLIETSTQAIVVADPEGRLEEVNQAAEELFAYAPGELTGRPLQDLIPERYRGVHPGHVAAFFQEPRTGNMGQAQGLEITGLRKDGGEVSLLVVLHPLRGAGHSGVMAVIVDHTAMEAQRKELAFLHEVSMVLAQDDNPQEKAQKVLAEMVNFAGAHYGFLRTLDETGESLRLAAWWPDSSRSALQTVVPRDLYPKIELLEQGSTVVANPYPSEGFPYEPVIPEEVRSLVILPLLSPEGALFALVWVGWLVASAGVQDSLIRSLETVKDRLAALLWHFESSANFITAINVMEEDRDTVGMEIHDRIAQPLAAALYQLQAWEAMTGPSAQERDTVARAQGLLRATLADSRRLMGELHTPELETLGLGAAISARLKSFEQRTACACHAGLAPMPGLDPEVAVVVYRVFIEALTNIEKHSGATGVWVSLHPEDDDTVLEVRDNGPGFNANWAASGLGARGLAVMRGRAMLANGRCEIISQRGQGTTVRLRVPHTPGGGINAAS